ncbi:MAG: hypothetical protein ABEH80_06965, partial [Halobaculum sp.]
MSNDPADGPVLDPDEFDISDDERVAEIGDDRYVVSASGPPAGVGGDDRGRGGGGGDGRERRDDREHDDGRGSDRRRSNDTQPGRGGDAQPG